MPVDNCCEPAVLRLYDIRQLAWSGAQPKIISCRSEGENLVVTMTADAFIHGVHVRESHRMSDNYFDLLPGQMKQVILEGVCKCPEWHTVR